MLDSNTYIIKGSPGIIFDPGNTQYSSHKGGHDAPGRHRP